MATLIRYELRKILQNKFGIGACVLALLMVVGYCGAEGLTQLAFDLQSGHYVRGAEAIAVTRDRANAHTLITPEQVEADLAAYDEGLAVIDEFGDLSVEALYAQEGRDAAVARLRITGESYYGNLNAFTMYKAEDGTIANEHDLSLAARRSLRESLAKNHGDGLPYTAAERALWESRLSKVEFPLRWGYAAGWEQFTTGISIMTVAIIAVCIALSSVFAGEYQTGTAAITLPTLHGKSKSVRAKVAASLLFALAYYTVCAVICAAVTFGFFGTDGSDLPVQVDTIWSPYGLSMGQYGLITLALGYLVLLGCAAVTLLISSKVRGPMPAAVIPMAVIFLGIIVATFFPPLERIMALLPWNVLEGNICESLVSYGIGPVAVDRLVVVPVLYLLVVVACVPLAMRSFARHQLA